MCSTLIEGEEHSDRAVGTVINGSGYVYLVSAEASKV